MDNRREDVRIDSDDERIQLAHGSGGRLMHNLVDSVFRKEFSNAILDELSDSAVLDLKSGQGSRICFTTDSYVVKPIFFPGGDIGKLAVCGTVNDLAVSGAKPLFISCGMIIEEGLPVNVLKKIVSSMAKTARAAGVRIVTGDTKVVEKGKADGLYINTSGIGLRDADVCIGRNHIQVGDRILINGSIGEHELAVLSVREGFNFEGTIKSDCASLNGLISEMLSCSGSIKFMRDPTRGGVATVLNEIVEGRNFGISIKANAIPAREDVKALCEMLGFDSLYLANEGKVIAVAGSKQAEEVLKCMKKHPLGTESAIIGEVSSEIAGKVTIETELGTIRIVDMLTGEQFPRIC